jgi:hypothetical protein
MVNLHKEILKFMLKVLIMSFISCMLMQWLVINDNFGYQALIYNLGIFQKLLYIFVLFVITGIVYILLGLALGLNLIKMLF